MTKLAWWVAAGLLAATPTLAQTLNRDCATMGAVDGGSCQSDRNPGGNTAASGQQTNQAGNNPGVGTTGSIGGMGGGMGGGASGNGGGAGNNGGGGNGGGGNGGGGGGGSR